MNIKKFWKIFELDPSNLSTWFIAVFIIVFNAWLIVWIEGNRHNQKEESKQPEAIEEVVVSIEFREVAEDGVFSHSRKYKAAKDNVHFHSKNSVLIVDATDEFGNKFKEILTIDTPVIIEEIKKTNEQ